MPKILVAVAAYNTSRWISEALSSIENQTFDDWGCLVMDDASTDNTRDVVRRFIKRDHHFKLYCQAENKGFGPNLTDAIDEGLKQWSDTEFIAIHGADDFSEPERFAKQVRFLEENSWCLLVGTWFKELAPDGTERIAAPICSPEGIRHAMTWYGTSMGHGTIIFRRKVWEEVHGYSPSMAQDFEWLERVEDRWPCSMANIPEPLYTWRRHPKQISQLRLKDVVDETGRILMEAQMTRKPMTAADFEEGKIKLDIGSGVAPPPGYLHADLVTGPDIEIVAPLTDIPLPDNSCCEVRLSHILEHQGFAELGIVMAEVKRLLIDNGTLKVMCPNLSFVCEKFAAAKTLEEQKKLLPELFGLQTIKWEYHLSGFTPELMRDYLEQNGFKEIMFDDCKETVKYRAVKE